MFVQALSAQGVAFGTPLRYRLLPGRQWSAGETVEIHRSELMFLCDRALEVNARVEIVLPAKVQVAGGDSCLTLLCTGQVVRRFLANWPDLRSAVVVNISDCQIIPDAPAGLVPGAASARE